MQHLIIFSIALSIWPTQALAYIGPGLGAGSIGVILGFLAAILLALFGIFYYPIKRLIKNRRAKQNDVATEDKDNCKEASNNPENCDTKSTTVDNKN